MQPVLNSEGGKLHWTIEQLDFAEALKRDTDGPSEAELAIVAPRPGKPDMRTHEGRVSLEAIDPVDRLTIQASERYTAVLVVSNQPLANRATARVAGTEATIGRATCGDHAFAVVANEWQDITLELSATQLEQPLSYRVLALSDVRPPYAELLIWFVGHDARWTFGDDKRPTRGDECVASIHDTFAISPDAFNPVASREPVETSRVPGELLKMLQRVLEVAP